MEAEAKPFIEHMELKLIENFFPKQTPFLAYDGMHHNARVTVITFGKDNIYGTGVDNVGTVPSSLATFLAIQKFSAGPKEDDEGHPSGSQEVGGYGAPEPRVQKERADAELHPADSQRR